MGDSKIVNRIFNYIIFDVRTADRDLLKIYYTFFKNKFIAKFHMNSDFIDLSSEAFFWERAFRQRHLKDRSTPPYGKKAEKSKDSIQTALNYIETNFDPPYRFIDVGCGPTSQFNTNDLRNRSDLEIISVDPLAETYINLHKKYKTGYDIKCIYGYGEKLTDLFPKNHFHLVYSQNSIDHSQNPVKFMDNLCEILIKGGYLVLYGFIREGSAAKWLGLHQWDIEFENGYLLLTSRDKSIFKEMMINGSKMDLIYEEVSGSNIGDTYTLIYKKN